jgi:hypothetical protein
VTLSVTITVSNRSKIVVVDAAYRPEAPCSLIFLIFSYNLEGAPYINVCVIVRKLRYTCGVDYLPFFRNL